jgi:hypothetical protein
MAGAAEGEHPRSSIITLDRATHIYRVDGAPVDSVTQLLEAAGISPDYRKVHPAVLRHARLRGIHVDACCDLDDADDLDWSSVHPEAVGYVQAWQAFKADYGYEPVISQPLVYHPVYGYAGEPDSIGMLGDYVAVAERKATAKMAASYALQTAGYACEGLHMAPRGGGRLEPVPWGGPVMRLGVHLMPGGRYDLVPYEDPDDEAAWLGVVALARWRKLRH